MRSEAKSRAAQSGAKQKIEKSWVRMHTLYTLLGRSDLLVRLVWLVKWMLLVFLQHLVDVDVSWFVSPSIYVFFIQSFFSIIFSCFVCAFEFESAKTAIKWSKSIANWDDDCIEFCIHYPCLLDTHRDIYKVCVCGKMNTLFLACFYSPCWWCYLKGPAWWHTDIKQWGRRQPCQLTLSLYIFVLLNAY